MSRRLILMAAAISLTITTNAQKGNIGFVYPAGAQRGTSVEITVGGQNLSRATGIIISGEGVSGELIPTPKSQQKKKRSKKNIGEEDNLQLADQVRFRVSIAEDAPLGIRDLRLVMPDGTSNRLYFEIGQLPDILEDSSAELSATATSLPVTFNGQVMRSDVDRFRFKASKGEQLVISVKGRIFVPYMADAVPGWFQPVLRLFGPDGKECAYSDDYTFHVDPVIFYKVPESGDYEIEIKDGLYRGREDFVYRIDVGELPFITGISPLGGPVGKKTKVQLRGYNLKKKVLTVKPSHEGVLMLSSTGSLNSNAPRSSSASRSAKAPRSTTASRSAKVPRSSAASLCSNAIPFEASTLEPLILPNQSPRSRTASDHRTRTASDSRTSTGTRGTSSSTASASASVSASASASAPASDFASASAGNYSRSDAALIRSGQVCEMHFSEAFQQHWFYFEAENRNPLHLKVNARRLGAPTDVRMTLYDSNMDIVKDVDDFEDSDDYLATHFADPEIIFKPKPGYYLVRLIESQGHSGEDYAYRFSVAASEPDFSLHIEPATISVPEGGTAVFNVLMTPKQNFRGAVNLQVDGLPEGFKLKGTRIEPGRKKTLVSVTAPASAPHTVILPKVTGTSGPRVTASDPRATASGPRATASGSRITASGPRATTTGRTTPGFQATSSDPWSPTSSNHSAEVTREAVPVESMMQAFYYTHLMPMEEFRVEIVDEIPFRIEILSSDSVAGKTIWKKGELQLSPGDTIQLPVRIIRKSGFDSPVNLMLRSSEPFVKAEAVVIPEGETEAVLELTVKDNYKSPLVLKPRLAVYGVVKSTSKKIAGRARNAYVSSITAWSEVFIAKLPPKKPQHQPR